MATATLTSKGQTTIPQEIRSYLGIESGDRLEFIINDNGQVLLAPATVDIRELKGCLPKPKKPVSVEKMNQAIAKRGAQL